MMTSPFIDFLSWRSALDILLITLALFFVYNTIRRLGTWKTLLGVLMVFGIYFIAKSLDLSGIVWLYNNVSQVAVIGVIVLFQPEIRKLFERSVTVTPDKVKALVRKSDLKDSERALATTPIYLENLKASATLLGKVVVPPKIQPVDRKWPDVEIKLKIEKKAKSRL